VIESPATGARPRLRRQALIRDMLEPTLLVILIYTVVNLATARYFIIGPSMRPQFSQGQVLVVSKLSYLLRAPERGDIVVFYPPNNAPDPLIKRLIGVPGDTVEFRAGQLYVNDVLWQEPYLQEVCAQNCQDNLWLLGDDEYFLMGDNRNNSHDSRAFGVVPRSHIVGEAIVRYWPLPDVGIVSRIGFPNP
jgi:signal peptidase I